MLMSAQASLECPPHCSACRLRQTDAFSAVKPAELAFVEAFRSATSQISAGGTIIYEQKPSGKLFTLYSGWAFRYKTLSDGRRQILNFLLPGDFIGLQQEFADSAMHGIEAVTDVALCVFPRNGLWDLFRNHPSLGYDGEKDFAPITLLAVQPMVFCVDANSPLKSARELIAFGKTKDKRATYGTGGVGSAAHLTGEMFNSTAGTSFTHIPYKGTAPLAVAIISSELAMGVISAIDAIPQLKGGKLRCLAVSTAKRSPTVPEIPAGVWPSSGSSCSTTSNISTGSGPGR